MNKKRNSVEVDNLVENHQDLVYHLAMRVFRSLPVKHDLDDLIGYGMIGLIEAANKYEPSRRIEFTTFAYPRINGAIYDGVSKLSWMSRSRYKRLMKERESAEKTGEASSAEILSVRSLDTETAQEIEAPEESNAETEVAKVEELAILGSLIAELANREERLITMIYIEGLSFQAAAERLGISKSWASRMHRKTLTHLANAIKEKTR